MSMLDKAMNYLLQFGSTEHELKLYLSEQYALSSDEEKITQVLSFLKKHHLINDERIARQLASTSLHKGNQYIKSMLEQRQIASTIINRICAELPGEFKRALIEAQNKRGNLSNICEDHDSNAIRRFLRGRQFHPEIIEQVINKMFKLQQPRLFGEVQKGMQNAC